MYVFDIFFKRGKFTTIYYNAWRIVGGHADLSQTEDDEI